MLCAGAMTQRLCIAVIRCCGSAWMASTDGTLFDSGTGCFADLKRSLLEPEADGVADRYFVLGDFQSMCTPSCK